MRYFLYLLFSSCLLLLSCEKEEPPMPAYIQELAEMHTDSEGYARTLTLDQGTVLQIGNKVGGLKADTLYRIRALYQQSGSTVWLSNFAPVLTPHLTHHSPEVIKTDPVSLTACWRGQHYLNLRLNIRATAEGKHLFGFHEAGLQRYSNGTQTLQAVLLHDQNNDPAYYTREVFLSLPLRPLTEKLQSGRDTLQLSIPSREGWIVRKMIF